MTEYIRPMTCPRPQASIGPRPLPPGLPVPTDVRIALSATSQPLPIPTKGVCEKYSSTANVNLTSKPLASTPLPVLPRGMAVPATRHTRDRSRSIRGCHPLQLNVAGGLELVRMKGRYDPVMVMHVDENQPLLSSTKFNIQLNTISSPVITIKLPSSPFSLPTPQRLPNKKTPTVAYQAPLPHSPTSPPPRPPFSNDSPGVISPREARARLLASMMLKRFQGGRSRRSSCLASGGFTKKPSGLAQVSFPVDDDSDDESESEDGH